MQNNSFIKNTRDISPEIQNLAEMKELGELRKVYPVWKAATSFWAGGQICVAFDVLGLLIDALTIITVTSFTTRRPLEVWEFIFALTTFGLLLIGLRLYMLLSRRIYTHWQVSLWHNGFIYEKKQIRQVFRWNQIESVQGNVTARQNGPVPRLYTYKVRRQDDYEVELGSTFSDAPELIDRVLEESARHLAPQGLNIASPSNTRTLTTLKLDQQGIDDGQEMQPWQVIQEFVTENGTVTLRKRTE